MTTLIRLVADGLADTEPTYVKPKAVEITGDAYSCIEVECVTRSTSTATDRDYPRDRIFLAQLPRPAARRDLAMTSHQPLLRVQSGPLRV